MERKKVLCVKVNYIHDTCRVMVGKNKIPDGEGRGGEAPKVKSSLKTWVILILMLILCCAVLALLSFMPIIYILI